MRKALALALVACTAWSCSAQRSTEPPPSVPEATKTGPSVREVTITVSDLTASTNFALYVLDATLIESTLLEGQDFSRLTGVDDAQARIRWFEIGDERIAFRQFLGKEGQPVAGEARSNDPSFQHLALVVSDIDRAHQQVSNAAIRPVSIDGPQTIPLTNPDAGGVRAYYFRDPDGHPLELIWYPPGKGQAKWQQSDALFIGIDHTAIAVSDTARSEAFYASLGLEVAGRSLNQGVEQERLSGVPGARVRITGLRGPEGYGVEFLEYLTPVEPHANARQLEPTDIGFYETSVMVDDFSETVARIEALGVTTISTGVGRCGRSCLEGRRAVVVRDPDGHAVRIVEAP